MKKAHNTDRRKHKLSQVTQRPQLTVEADHPKAKKLLWAARCRQDKIAVVRAAPLKILLMLFEGRAAGKWWTDEARHRQLSVSVVPSRAIRKHGCKGNEASSHSFEMYSSWTRRKIPHCIASCKFIHICHPSEQ